MRSSVQKWLIVSVAVLVTVGTLTLAHWLRRPVSRSEVKRYPITGVVLAVRPEINRVTVANDKIAGFMEPMVMDYSLKAPAQLSGLKRGDDIRATLASDGARQWVLEDVTVTTKR